MRTAQKPLYHSLACLGLLALLVITPSYGVARGDGSAAFFALVIEFSLLVMVAGHWVTGCWRGALINDRNRISLDQTQVILWTILVLSAFLTGVQENIASESMNPLEIEVPTTVWVLLGISTTTLVGAPLIESRKKAQSSDDREQAEAMNKLVNQGRNGAFLTTSGRLIANERMTDARWTDLFEAEELSRSGRIDMGKIQMTLFTVVVGMAYAAEISRHLALEGGFSGLPPLSETMVTLVGISHAGYLATKAVPEREGI